MTGVAVKFDGLAHVDWGTSVSGVDLLRQKVICNMLTRNGSDRMIPTRGTDLDVNLMSVGAYDLMSIQHELNFAAVKTRQDLRAYETSTNPSDLLADFKMNMTGYSNGRPEVALRIYNSAGEYAAPTLTL